MRPDVMPWPTTVFRPRAAHLVVQRQNECSAFEQKQQCIPMLKANVIGAFGWTRLSMSGGPGFSCGRKLSSFAGAGGLMGVDALSFWSSPKLARHDHAAERRHQ